MPTYDIERVIAYIISRYDPGEFVEELLKSPRLDYEDLLWALAEFIEGFECAFVPEEELEDYDECEV